MRTKIQFSLLALLGVVSVAAVVFAVRPIAARLLFEFFLPALPLAAIALFIDLCIVK